MFSISAMPLTHFTIDDTHERGSPMVMTDEMVNAALGAWYDCDQNDAVSMRAAPEIGELG
jgi:hypothetical protein